MQCLTNYSSIGFYYYFYIVKPKKENVMKRYFYILILIVAIFSTQTTKAKLNVIGKVKFDRVSVENVSIEISKNGKIDTLVFSDSKGRFIVILEMNHTYNLVISKDDFYSHKINIDTRLEEEEKYTWRYKFVVDLIPDINSKGVELFNETLGNVKYNSNTDSFENEINPLFMSKYQEFLFSYETEKSNIFNNVLSNADTAFNQGDYDLANQLYAKATVLDEYCKYADIQLDMIEKIIVQDVNILHRYNKNIELADNYYVNKNFNKARKRYLRAYSLKQEEYPKVQISKIKKIVSLKEVLASH